MKNVELKWTDSNEAHIARHGVAPIEVEQVLSSEPLVWVNGRGRNDARLRAELFGPLALGRIGRFGGRTKICRHVAGYDGERSPHIQGEKIGGSEQL